MSFSSFACLFCVGMAIDDDGDGRDDEDKDV